MCGVALSAAHVGWNEWKMRAFVRPHRESIDIQWVHMRALRYHGEEKGVQLEEVERPAPGTNQVLVRITASGICRADLRIVHGEMEVETTPVTIGHEAVGVIEETGPGVPSSRGGTRVIVYFYAGCGECRRCRRGEENLCANIEAKYGFSSHGGHADYIVVPAQNAVPLPDRISDVQAVPIACGLTTGLHALHRADLRYGHLVVVYGLGNIGFNLIQLSAMRGARVIAVDSHSLKLEKGRELGADVTINSGQGNVAERIDEIAVNRGADVVFECLGVSETVRTSIKTLGRRGRLVMIGHSDRELTIDPHRLVTAEQEIVGSVGAGLQDLFEAVKLVEDERVRTVVDRSLPLKYYEEGLRAMQRGELVGKAVLVPS